MHRMILNETSYHGSGAIKELGPEIKKRGFKKAFVVTDEGVIKAGVLDKITEQLDQAGITYDVFSDVFLGSCKVASSPTLSSTSPTFTRRMSFPFGLRGSGYPTTCRTSSALSWLRAFFVFVALME